MAQSRLDKTYLGMCTSNEGDQISRGCKVDPILEDQLSPSSENGTWSTIIEDLS